jgi:hypothetical protein
MGGAGAVAQGGGSGLHGGRTQAMRYRFGDYLFDSERYELQARQLKRRSGEALALHQLGVVLCPRRSPRY